MDFLVRSSVTPMKTARTPGRPSQKPRLTRNPTGPIALTRGDWPIPRSDSMASTCQNTLTKSNFHPVAGWIIPTWQKRSVCAESHSRGKDCFHCFFLRFLNNPHPNQVFFRFRIFPDALSVMSGIAVFSAERMMGAIKPPGRSDRTGTHQVDLQWESL